MTAPVSRDTWQRALLTPGTTLTANERMTLLVCARFMSRDGRLSKPEKELAAEVGVDWRTVARHRKAAVAKGWLIRSAAGRHGTTAVYLASLPVRNDTLQPVNLDRLRAVPACQLTGRYEPFQPVKPDTPSLRPSRAQPRKTVVAKTRLLRGEGRTTTARFVYPLGSQRGQLLGRGVIPAIPNRKPGKHASHSDNSRSVIAGFAFVSARVATTEGAA